MGNIFSDLGIKVPSILKAYLFRVNLYILLLSHLLNPIEADLVAVVEHLHHPAVLSVAAVVLGGAVDWLYGGAVGLAQAGSFSRRRRGLCRGCVQIFHNVDQKWD